ncbi:MAG: hypothetical protein HPY52_06565 [Firmicutes bacterium]|nr:hypothetical protein [Bacillota bacterium]
MCSNNLDKSEDLTIEDAELLPYRKALAGARDIAEPFKRRLYDKVRVTGSRDFSRGDVQHSILPPAVFSSVIVLQD